MVLLGCLYALMTGRMDVVAQGAVNAGGEAIETVLEMSGAFMLFGGIAKVLEKTGATGAVVRILRWPLRKLFGRNVSEEALQAVTMNMTANMLGMGNAATPMGLKAARLLNPDRQSVAPSALCLLLVLNSTAIELFPATVIALRYAARSENAAAIVIPTFVSTTVSACIGVMLCKLMERRRKK